MIIKIRPGEPLSVDSAEAIISGMFFDARRYDLARVGRYKYNKKLAFQSRIVGQFLPRNARITVWALSISLAATLEIDKFSFSSSGYLDVSVPQVPHVQLCIHCTLTEVSSAGFPHSDISGSLDMCSSPKLFAAYHVFHRLLVPRHPPCALTTLTVAGTIESLDSLFPH